MARKQQDTPEVDFTLDNSFDESSNVVTVGTSLTEPTVTQEEPKQQLPTQGRTLINCLRKEIIIVKPILRQKNGITDPKHVLYGGMSNNAKRIFSVPRLSSGIYVNVLTNDEKAFLENVMGLEYNALSIHKKVDNFWDDSNEMGISRVELRKEENRFDLSTPEGYIRYKILLANKNTICPSMKEWTDNPKATYQFIIINEGDETKTAKQNMTNIQRCYKEFGKIEEDKDTLRTVIEIITGRTTAAGTGIDWLQTKVNELIQADPRVFLNAVTDDLLKYKVLIKRAHEAGIVSYRGNHLYITSTGVPMCDNNEEPTLSVAARYLSNPKHQDVLFAIQAKLK